ncbi:MAG: pyrimidine dimer DNA glycosylase/endonuclease V [Chitinophagales bacterium]
MRIWSIHPKYLDSKGLVAVWRETLLAKTVLKNKTKGYKNHPQLHRFKESKKPLHCINQYLVEIYKEAEKRNYSFDKSKIKKDFKRSTLTVTTGQVDFEIRHLKRKLKLRDRKKLKEIMLVRKFESHPLFKIIEGETESWEKF